MLSDSVPVPEIVVPADAWASPVAVKHALTHDDIDLLIAQYLASGNKIQVVQIGTAAKQDDDAKDDMVRRGVRNPYLAADQKKKLSRIHAGDSDLVAHIAVQLPAHPQRKQLLQELNCGDSKLQRLLRMYFHEDRSADYLRVKDRLCKPGVERERRKPGPKGLDFNARKALAEKLREAAARGMNKTSAKHFAGIGYTTVEVIAIEFDITFPKTIKRQQIIPHDQVAETLRPLCATMHTRQISQVTGLDPNIIRKVAKEFGIELLDGRSMRKKEAA